jgi:hypothetical protein
MMEKIETEWHRASTDDGSGGFALLVVLSFLLLAASISAPFLVNARDDALISRNAARERHDRSVAEGTILVAAQRYFESAAEANNPHQQIRCRGEGRFPDVLLSFTNHAGLVDLNAASSELLQIGFRAVGGSGSEATRLANLVKAYRSVEPGRSGDIAAGSVVGGLKHGLFESVSELLDFETEIDFTGARLGRVFTVHSRSGVLDADSTTSELGGVLNSSDVRRMPFVIFRSGRLPAFSVGLQLLGKDETSVSASAIFVPSENGRVQQAGPLTIERRKSGKALNIGGFIDCQSFFDAGSIKLLGALLQ